MVGFVEKWSGKLLRWLMAYLFFIGVAFSAWFVFVEIKLAAIIYGAFLMAPYLVIRYRDPASTTIPLQSRFMRKA